MDWDPQKAIDGKVINFETVFCCRFNSKREGDSSWASSLFELKKLRMENVGCNIYKTGA